VRQVRGRLCFAFQETRNHRVEWKETQTRKLREALQRWWVGERASSFPSQLTLVLCNILGQGIFCLGSDLRLGGESLIEVGDGGGCEGSHINDGIFGGEEKVYGGFQACHSPRGEIRHSAWARGASLLSRTMSCPMLPLILIALLLLFVDGAAPSVAPAASFPPWKGAACAWQTII